jgi:hypothetical protein
MRVIANLQRQPGVFLSGQTVGQEADRQSTVEIIGNSRKNTLRLNEVTA